MSDRKRFMGSFTIIIAVMIREYYRLLYNILRISVVSISYYVFFYFSKTQARGLTWFADRESRLVKCHELRPLSVINRYRSVWKLYEWTCGLFKNSKIVRFDFFEFSIWPGNKSVPGRLHVCVRYMTFKNIQSVSDLFDKILLWLLSCFLFFFLFFCLFIFLYYCSFLLRSHAIRNKTFKLKTFSCVLRSKP